MNIDLQFDESARDFVLEAFGKTTDEAGYIVEKSDPAQRVLTRDGQEIKKEEFAGVTKGSEIYIKSDLISLIEISDALHQKEHRSGLAQKS
jgi:hypothetical protein